MLTIGIDCGVSGAVAVIDENRAVRALFDLPVMERGATKWIDAETLMPLLRDARSGERAHVAIEQLWAMPRTGLGAGAGAQTSKGLTFGSTLAVLQLAGLPFDFVAPAAWKRKLGLVTAGPKLADNLRKRAALNLARQYFPHAELHLQKHHNRAEALLIAHYYRRYVWDGVGEGRAA